MLIWIWSDQGSPSETSQVISINKGYNSLPRTWSLSKNFPRNSWGCLCPQPAGSSVWRRLNLLCHEKKGYRLSLVILWLMDICYNLRKYRIKKQLWISDILPHCRFWHMDTNSKSILLHCLNVFVLVQKTYVYWYKLKVIFVTTHCVYFYYCLKDFYIDSNLRFFLLQHIAYMFLLLFKV